MICLKEYILEAIGDFTVEDILNDKGHQKIINAYIPYIWSVINDLGKYKKEYKEDMFQEGIYGILYAIKHYDTNKTLKQFGHYVTKSIHGRIHEFVLNNAHTVRMPASLIKSLKYKEEQHNVSLQHLLIGDECEFDKDFNFHDAIIDTSNDTKISAKLGKHIVKLLQQSFKDKQIEMFCRVWRLNEYDNETKKQKEIAAEYGIKPTTFCVQMKNMINYLKQKLKVDDITESLTNLPKLIIIY